MKSPKNPPVNEFEDGKYIIIKIPRESLQESDTFSFKSLLGEKNLKKGTWIVLCIVSLFIGIILGSVFHPHLFHQVPDKAVWKGSYFMIPNGK